MMMMMMMLMVMMIMMMMNVDEGEEYDNLNLMMIMMLVPATASAQLIFSNPVLKFLPLPLVDILAVVKDNEENAAKVFKVCHSIEQRLYSNTLAANAGAAPSSDAIVITTQPAGGSGAAQPAPAIASIHLTPTTGGRRPRSGSILDESRASRTFGVRQLSGSHEAGESETTESQDEVCNRLSVVIFPFSAIIIFFYNSLLTLFKFSF